MSNKLTYIVASGDTYTSIVNKINQSTPLTVSQLADANPSIQANQLQIGQALDIPLSTDGLIPDDNPALLTPAAEFMGYWYPYSASCPKNATLSVALYGWGPQKVIEWGKQADVQHHLHGEKYLSFGGGSESGKFTEQALNEITTAITQGQIKGYDGIAYDVEVADANLGSQFANSFEAAKACGFKVLVTISHSAPYDVADKDQLMKSFFINPHIDILSPQLYSKGDESHNDYALTSGSSITWRDYASAKAAIVPSIVHASYYEAAKIYFKNQGVELSGYLQWK